MTDQELADALVAAGILEVEVLRGTPFYILPGHYDCQGNETKGVARWAVNDWRVAGACMGRCENFVIVLVNVIKRRNLGYATEALHGEAVGEAQDESLPRATCEAYVESLKGN